jgi:hypothetical protein
MLGEHPAGVDELCKFLDLDPALLERQELPRANTGGLPRSRTLTAVLSRRNPIRSSLRVVLPSGIRARARRTLVQRNTTKPALDPGTRARLQELYRGDVCELESLIDRDLSHWLRPSN